MNYTFPLVFLHVKVQNVAKKQRTFLFPPRLTEKYFCLLFSLREKSCILGSKRRKIYKFSIIATTYTYFYKAWDGKKKIKHIKRKNIYTNGIESSSHVQLYLKTFISVSVLFENQSTLLAYCIFGFL